ncbi:phosphatidate cytidylyltransferase [Berryella wangjianweii]|uniref:phosphatidate cytidylyltransferase n=1 Tax=Berryella wangjianweii TaxID=2734634 RepID=UPI0021BDC753|nr:phosphatidate cytidylyltransferase [Berryella wangjianweii]
MSERSWNDGGTAWGRAEAEEAGPLFDAPAGRDACEAREAGEAVTEKADAVVGGADSEGAHPEGRRFRPSDHPNLVEPEAEADAERRRVERLKSFAYQKTPSTFKNASDLQIRTRTGVVYVALCVAAMLAGDLPAMVFLAGVSAICAAEFFYMLRSDAKMPNEWIGTVGAAMFPPAAYLWGLQGIMLVAMLLLAALTVWYVFWNRARMQDVGVSLLGALYTGMQLSFIVLLRMALPEPHGGTAVLLLFITIWSNDVFAYLVGRRFGRHKMAPRTSPNKSWEGFVGGLAACMAAWCGFAFIPGMSITIVQALFIGLACGLAGVLGDLCESRIKRSVGFKDSGTIMPGHGGLFDRCDSLMTTATAAFALLTIFRCIPLVR